MTTDTLVAILKHHDQYPFSLVELQRIFEEPGLSNLAEAELGRLTARRTEYLQLTAAVLQVFEELQRQQENSQPISASAAYLLLLHKSQLEQLPRPDVKQISQVLELLSNPVLSLLTRDGDGYVLTLSPAAVSQRMAVLHSRLLPM